MGRIIIIIRNLRPPTAKRPKIRDEDDVLEVGDESSDPGQSATCAKIRKEVRKIKIESSPPPQVIYDSDGTIEDKELARGNVFSSNLIIFAI